MDNESRAKSFGGAAVLGAMITGGAALVLAVVSGASARFEASGLALLAAAAAFVGLANAIFRV